MPAKKILSLRNNVSPVSDAQRFAHIVVGNQNADAAGLQVKDDLLQLQHRNRIDAAEWLIQQDKTPAGCRGSGQLLEPTNREAKLFVAACLRNNTIERAEEARRYYREVIEDPVQDKWSEIARKALSASFAWGDADAKVMWFGSAAASTTDSNATQFYRRGRGRKN